MLERVQGRSFQSGLLPSALPRLLAVEQPVPAVLTPEQQQILTAIRRGFPSSRLTPTPSGEQSLDWYLLLRLAFELGVAPLLRSGLAAAGTAVPSRVRAIFETSYMAAAARVRDSIAPTFREVQRALAGVGIEPIVLKGTALAYAAYANPAYRTMADIDLLLDAAEVERAEAVLATLGLRGSEPRLRATHHLRPLHAEGRQVSVELHFALLPSENPFRLDLEDMRARAGQVEIAGVPARVLAPADALLHTCVHLAYSHRYRWYPLRGLTDILALTTNPEAAIDWPMLVETVRRSRLAGAVYWPLWMSRAWLAAPIPAFVLAALAPAAPLRRYLAALANPAYLFESNASAVRERDVLYNLLVDLSLRAGCSAGAQWRSVLRSLFPSPDAVEHLPAEVRHSPLRYTARLVHPMRVARGLRSGGRLLASTAQPYHQIAPLAGRQQPE